MIACTMLWYETYVYTCLYSLSTDGACLCHASHELPELSTRLLLSDEARDDQQKRHIGRAQGDPNS